MRGMLETTAPSTASSTTGQGLVVLSDAWPENCHTSPQNCDPLPSASAGQFLGRPALYAEGTGYGLVVVPYFLSPYASLKLLF